MNTPNMICGVCQVGEVKQEGAVMKCQNGECKNETPIDVNMALAALRLDGGVSQSVNYSQED